MYSLAKNQLIRSVVHLILTNVFIHLFIYFVIGSLTNHLFISKFINQPILSFILLFIR